MKLSLAVTQKPDNILLESAHICLDKSGATIGRGKECIWSIPDSSRVISTLHMVVEYRAGQYLLFDKSTNGVFVNGSFEALGVDNPHLLSDGDRIRLGEIEITVTIDLDESELITPLDELFDRSLDEMSVSHRENASAVSYEDIFNSDGVASSHSNEFDAMGPEVVDPLLALNGGDCEQSMGVYGIDRSEKLGPLLDTDSDFSRDLLRESMPRVNVKESKMNPHPDLSSNSTEDVSGLIPDNWNMSQIAEVDDSVVSTDLIKEDSSLEVIDQRELESSQEGLDGSTEIHQLMAALGMNPDQFTIEQKSEFIPAVAQFITASVEGLMQALRARTAMKNEYRMGLTMITPQDNNPLKFSASCEEVLLAMFCHQSSAYLSGEMAVKEAFNDINEHQVGLLAGMQEAYQRRLGRLSPRCIQEEYSRQSTGPRLQSRKALLWDLYEKRAAELESAGSVEEDDLFERNFSLGYEKRIKELTNNGH